MRGIILFMLFTGIQSGFAQRLLSFKPTHPVICYQSSETRPDHIGISEKLKQWRKDGTARMKAARIEVQYINFPADNIAKTAFQYAVDIWESELTSPVPIRIMAEWKPLESGVLGEAVWGRAYANFGGEQHLNTFYPVALAEKLSGRELNDASEADVVASFNSNASWYFGTDGNTPAGKMDMVTIVLHEIAHGLGFTDTYDVEGAEGSVGLSSGGISVPFIFDLFVEDGASDNLVDDFQSPSPSLKVALQSTNLFFNSPLSVAALGGTKPELFAPSTFDGGSSISHLDEGTFSASGDANRLMTPHIAFGESIHVPGGALLGMLGDMGWVNVDIQHAPLKDTEIKNGQPYNITAIIGSDNGYDAGQVKLHYTSDGTNFTVVNMTPTGVADQFQSALPGTTTNMAYSYFISVPDGKNRIFTNPGKMHTSGAAPEQGTHFFNIGPDLAAPEISHDPVTFILESDEQLSVTAEVTDNLGLAEVLAEYRVNDGGIQTAILVRAGNTDEYSALIAVPALDVGDEIHYRIIARDRASAENITIHPAAGYHVVAVNGILPARDAYINDFNDPSADFFGSNFTITTPSGFSDGAIHSDHPYQNGTGVNEESNYVYQLQIPIRIDNTNPVIRFEEIVLVEPGEDGSEFGDPGFFDYVILEGSVDGGRSWMSFAPGYDSREVSVWLDRYNEKMLDDDSQGQGEAALYRRRNINMLENRNFTAGDEVLIRFRLFADALAHGWGWAIDNLSIQGPVTDVDESTSAAFKVYPVPVTKNLMVELLTPGDGALEIQILDLQGRILHLERLTNLPPGMFERSFGLHSLKAGIYLLHIKAGAKVYTRKFHKAE